MKRDETDKVGRTLQGMAKESNLQLAEYSPEIQSMIGETGTLKVSLLLKGDFFNLQPFLLQICRLPYLDAVDGDYDQVGQRHERVPAAVVCWPVSRSSYPAPSSFMMALVSIRPRNLLLI